MFGNFQNFQQKHKAKTVRNYIGFVIFVDNTIELNYSASKIGKEIFVSVGLLPQPFLTVLYTGRGGKDASSHFFLNNGETTELFVLELP